MLRLVCLTFLSCHFVSIKAMLRLSDYSRKSQHLSVRKPNADMTAHDHHWTIVLDGVLGVCQSPTAQMICHAIFGIAFAVIFEIVSCLGAFVQKDRK